jgi:tRNA modification GTPase
MSQHQQTLDIDTIVAIATPSGTGGVGVIRLSGPLSHTIGLALSKRERLTPRFAHYCDFLDAQQQVIDSGLLLFFPGPKSFTGEDVVEIQGHGGQVVIGLLLQRCLALGAREARPGEFSERAFLNDKLDLIQAEALADLIHAQTEATARQAQASLRGTFSKQVAALAEKMLQLRIYVEAAIDFPEEEIDFLSDGNVAEQLNVILALGAELRGAARQGVIYRHGATVVLAGKPNAGKSSLMNVLAEDQIAIVTDQPGTTRDVVREHINIAGVPLRLTDTAGLRESSDVIEQEGVKRAKQAIQHADIVLHVIDDADESATFDTDPHTHLVTVLNKIDLTGRTAGLVDHPNANTTPCVAISTYNGAGIDDLKKVLLKTLGINDHQTDSLFSARERHITAIDNALSTLEAAQTQFLASGAGELLAEDLRFAHEQLASITGKITSDALLGEIFSSFCIGK